MRVMIHTVRTPGLRIAQGTEALRRQLLSRTNQDEKRLSRETQAAGAVHAPAWVLGDIVLQLSEGVLIPMMIGIGHLAPDRPIDVNQLQLAPSVASTELWADSGRTALVRKMNWTSQ